MFFISKSVGSFRKNTYLWNLAFVSSATVSTTVEASSRSRLPPVFRHLGGGDYFIGAHDSILSIGRVEAAQCRRLV